MTSGSEEYDEGAYLNARDRKDQIEGDIERLNNDIPNLEDQLEEENNSYEDFKNDEEIRLNEQAEGLEHFIDGQHEAYKNAKAWAKEMQE